MLPLRSLRNRGSVVAVVTRPAARIGVLSFAVLSLAAGSVWAATINGTAGNDTLRGGPRADTIYGKGGDDKLYGAGGNDRLIGGPGNDLIVGGPGDDRLIGGPGNDRLVGGPGADIIHCGPGRDAVIRDVRDRVARDCEVVRGPAPVSPPPPPPLPPPPPPPPAPGAPATYVFGAELSASQQALVRRGLDAGARYYRAALGRELPPFGVWAYADLEAMIRAYAETRPTSADDARRLWQGGQVGHALIRKFWLGPGWFISGRPVVSALKIAAHEAFHLLQYELVGERPLSVSSLDEIPPAGPWWLAEGTAEYFAYLAVVEDGAARFADVRAQWMQSTKASSATLRALATFRGQRENSAPYDIYALATELLLRGRDPKLVFTYYEAIARGMSWPDAFAATFGRTFDGFVDEFEAYRGGL
jgi:RTX calcium-binding nonapeptide repeat (4 copies)